MHIRGQARARDPGNSLHRFFTCALQPLPVCFNRSTKKGGGPENMEAYTVALNGKPIDTVYFQDGTDPQDVKRSLIDHDGYSPEIVVIPVYIFKAINGAIATRGKNKGQLKAKCPPSNTDAAAAWQAIQMEANPYKVSMATCLFFSERQTRIFNCIVETIRRQSIDVRGLDRDRVALESIGVW